MKPIDLAAISAGTLVGSTGARSLEEIIAGAAGAIAVYATRWILRRISRWLDDKTKL